MTKIHIHSKGKVIFTDPDAYEFEVIERKFRGHPDSLADMIAKRFSQLYIKKTWKLFPELKNKCFPNFSADKVTLSGASTNWVGGKNEVIKPVHALLIGKITTGIGDVSLNVDAIFKEAIEDIFEKALGHTSAHEHTVREIYSVNLAGTDHNKGFYNPATTKELLKIMSTETVANDTVYVVAYAPLSLAEKLSIQIESITASDKFKNKFPKIGTDIKAMIRRRAQIFDITLCLPVIPDEKSKVEYQAIITEAAQYLEAKIRIFLQTCCADKGTQVNLWINTKDTADKKYFAVWGTALSKGDIGAVGRGNRHQGFISGIRPSTNEAVAGKNPNHFAGIIYQMTAEKIAHAIHIELGIPNVVYITANNGDALEKPNSIDVITNKITASQKKQIEEIILKFLQSIDETRLEFINEDIYEKFMSPTIS